MVARCSTGTGSIFGDGYFQLVHVGISRLCCLQQRIQGLVGSPVLQRPPSSVPPTSTNVLSAGDMGADYYDELGAEAVSQEGQLPRTSGRPHIAPEIHPPISMSLSVWISQYC